LPAFTRRLETPDSIVHVLLQERSVVLTFVSGGGGTRRDIEVDAPNVYLLSYGGESGLTYNTFVFGRAPAHAARVELAGFAQSLQSPIVAGAFVVALKEKDVSPNDLHWTFLSGNGTVIARGSNITR
jgi:hypothetical protein